MLGSCERVFLDLREALRGKRSLLCSEIVRGEESSLSHGIE